MVAQDDGHDDLVRRLEERHAKLTAELQRLTEPPDPDAVVSFGKRVGDGTTEAVERITSTLTARSVAAAIAEVERALELVEDGTFGQCEICGSTIPAARLEARPYTARCVDHADL